MFVIYRRGCRPIYSGATLLRVERAGTLVYVEFAHEGQAVDSFASSAIERVEEWRDDVAGLVPIW
jgi:hypothetical protein